MGLTNTKTPRPIPHNRRPRGYALTSPRAESDTERHGRIMSRFHRLVAPRSGGAPRRLRLADEHR